jgi:SacI-like restriction endonuclease
MALQLERAVRLAEDPRQELPTEWIERTEHIAGCPSRTYVAALGVALLAKATDVRIDALTVKRKVSANAYSMRGAAAVLAGNASLYGYHLGVTGPEPLNNQPWFHGERIDQFRIEDREVEPYQNSLVRYLHELNGYDNARALLALAAFVRVRQRFAAELGAAQSNLARVGTPGLGRLLTSTEDFIRSNPEGGRRGQALVAALLDLAHDEVQLGAINDPRPRDVAVRRGELDLLLVEVKQKPVGSDTADHLASEAADASVDKALLVALAPDQQPLDRESIRASAEAAHGVLLLVCESVAELFTQIAIHSSLTATEVAERLPSVYLRRMQEHGVSEDGQRRWVDLCAGAERLC